MTNELFQFHLILLIAIDAFKREKKFNLKDCSKICFLLSAFNFFLIYFSFCLTNFAIKIAQFFCASFLYKSLVKYNKSIIIFVLVK